jgi:sugar transferase (PEP-CTERM/EpsH1 system associated)
MNLLFLTTTFPYPPNDGERVRSYNLLCQLSQKHKVTIVTFSDEESELSGVTHLQELGLEVHTCPRPTPSSLALYRALLTMKPLFVKRNASKKMTSIIAALVKVNHYDAVHLDGLPLIQYINLLSANKRIIFDLRDSWTVLYKRRYKNTSGLIKLINWIKWEAIKRYEIGALQLAVTPVLLSIEDKEAVVNMHPHLIGKIAVIPNGVDTDYFIPGHGTENSSVPQIIFTGSMAYAPNVEAVEYFVNNIWKKIRNRLPDAKFLVVGKKPGPNLLKLNSPSVSIMGEVDDIRPYIYRSQVVVCPLLSGAGIKNKVIEAMALGKSVVSTPIGIEGIPGVNGIHYLVCNDEQSFADAVISLIESPDKRAAMGKAARASVENTFCWRASAHAFESLYVEAD